MKAFYWFLTALLHYGILIQVILVTGNIVRQNQKHLRVAISFGSTSAGSTFIPWGGPDEYLYDILMSVSVLVEIQSRYQ